MAFHDGTSARRAASLLGLGLASALLVACGSDSKSDSDSRDQQAAEGVFLAGPISGLSYDTTTQHGVTGEDGRFRYLPGETVRFSVGGIDLGSAAGAAVVSAQQIVPNAVDSADPAVLNISRLLLTLDDDGNLANGLRITAATREAIASYKQANPEFTLDFADTAAFEMAAAGEGGLLAHLNSAGVFAENAGEGTRVLSDRFLAWYHLQDTLDRQAGKTVDHSRRPVLFIHGGAGSASQFESQAQRFLANGYPRSYLAVYEYNTNTDQDALNEEQAAERNLRIDAIIDHLRRISGADQIHLMGHSNGTRVSLMYLRDPARAAKVHRYVSIDGTGAEAPPGGVPTLALWGQYVTAEVTGAENVYPPEDAPVGHIEVATSAESFARIYRFFNGEDPAVTIAPPAEGGDVWLAGRANIFPQNIGAAGTTLAIFPVDPNTGMRSTATPLHRQPIGTDGYWGPFRVEKNATYEFALLREQEGADHYFYREGFPQDNYFIRLNTSLPNSGVGALLHRGPNHTNLAIARDKEFWADQPGRNDILTVNGVEVVTPQTAPLLKRLSSIFLHDRNSDGTSSLAAPDPVFHALPFMSGLDLHIPAASPPDSTVRIELTPRGGNGAKQVINVPNWPSSQVRSISVQFRDYIAE